MLQAREYHKYNEQIRQWITADGTLLKALVHTTSMPLRLYWQPVIPHIHHAIRADLSDEQLARFYTSIRPATGRYSYQSRLCLVSVWFLPVDARSEGRWTALDENSGYLVKAYEVYNALRYLAHRGQLKSSNVMYAIRHFRMDCVTKGRTTNEPRVLLGDLRHFESPNPTPDAAISDAALFESVACTAPENASDQGPNWQWVQLRGPDEVRVEVTISNLRLFSTDFLQAPAPTVTEVCNRLPHCELRVLAPAGQWSSFSSCGILAKKRELHEYFNKRYQIGRSHSATVFLCIGHKMQKYNRSTGERSNDGGILVAGLQPEIQ